MQIISILKQHEAGMPTKEVIRQVRITEQTFYRWKNKFGGMKGEENGSVCTVIDALGILITRTEKGGFHSKSECFKPSKKQSTWPKGTFVVSSYSTLV